MFIRVYFIFAFVAFIMYEFRLTRMFYTNATVLYLYRAGLTYAFRFTWRVDGSIFCQSFFASGCADRDTFNFNGGRFAFGDSNVGGEEIDDLHGFIRANIRRTTSRVNNVILCRMSRIILLVVQNYVIFIRSGYLSVKLFFVLLSSCGEFFIVVCQVMGAFNYFELYEGVNGRYFSFDFGYVCVSVAGCGSALRIKTVPFFMMVSWDLVLRIRGCIRYAG